MFTLRDGARHMSALCAVSIFAACSGVARLPQTAETLVQRATASVPLAHESLLYAFRGRPTDGALPNFGRLISDRAGNLYGATNTGGSGTCAFMRITTGCGTVFELVRGRSGWSERILYAFKHLLDGAGPYGTLVADAAGNLYGVTMGGGGNHGCVPLESAYHGCGTIFELSLKGTAWTKRTLHVFSGGIDGGTPEGGLAIDSHGNLYGTAVCGGGQYSCYYEGNGSGVFFELQRGSNGVWNEIVLHNFGQQGDGGNPLGDLTPMGSAILGSTPGAVYEMVHTSSGWSEKVLFSFVFGPGGYLAQGGLAFDSSGNLYGTTLQGGNRSGPCSGVNGCGVVYELTPSGGQWNETVLHTFSGYADGAGPRAGLSIDSNGVLYGTTANGGDLTCNNGGGCGIAFKLYPNGSNSRQVVLHTFEGNAADGDAPVSALTLSAGGVFGTTQYGGGTQNLGYGTVYELSP